jgi:dCMP deaminase
MIKDRFLKTHMQVADLYGQLSYSKRSKVGCIIVKNDSIIAIGYNGTPTGDDNCCEDENGVTKPTVIHAEINTLMKVAKSSESTIGGTMFITLSPCIECAKVILQSGIKDIYYRDEYRDTSGLQLLKKFGINVQQLKV